MSERERWQVVSSYQDGDRVVELSFNATESEVSEQKPRIIALVQEARADQDEGPVVTIEKWASPTPDAEEGND